MEEMERREMVMKKREAESEELDGRQLADAMALQVLGEELEEERRRIGVEVKECEKVRIQVVSCFFLLN